MEITWLGVIFIPLGMLLFVVSPEWLYRIVVFSIPFTATSLLNTSSGVPLTPFLFFGFLFIASQVLTLIKTGHYSFMFYGDRSLLLLIIFMGTVILSMIMPLIIDGSLMVSTNRLNDLYDVPIQLTAQTAKYPIPVVLGVILSLLWVIKNDSIDNLVSTLKIYVLSGVFVSLWAYLQFLCNNILGIDYPYYIFNTAVSEAMKGYTQEIDFGGESMHRVSSVLHEPSILAKYLLTVIPFMLVFVLMKRRLFGVGRDRLVLAILVGALLITTSTTAYLGLACLSVITAILMGRSRSGVRGWFMGMGLVGIIVGAAYSMFPRFQELLASMIFTKFESGSAFERYLSVTTSWEYFLKYPILGVGWAMVTCHDLIVYLLVSVGVVGFAAFSLLIFYVIRRSLWTLSERTQRIGGKQNDLFAICSGSFMSLIVLLMVGILTEVEFYLGYIYFILSMLIATNIIARAQYETECN